MPWDMLLVFGVLPGGLMLIAILGWIWQDHTPSRPPDPSPETKRAVSGPPVELDTVAGQENSLA